MAKLASVYLLIHSHHDGVDASAFEELDDAEESLKELAGDYYEKNSICELGDMTCAWIESARIR